MSLGFLFFLLNIYAALKAPDLGLVAERQPPRERWTGTNLGAFVFLLKASGLLENGEGRAGGAVV